jgi:hypothetical protein
VNYTIGLPVAAAASVETATVRRRLPVSIDPSPSRSRGRGDRCREFSDADSEGLSESPGEPRKQAGGIPSIDVSKFGVGKTEGLEIA